MSKHKNLLLFFIPLFFSLNCQQSNVKINKPLESAKGSPSILQSKFPELTFQTVSPVIEIYPETKTSDKPVPIVSALPTSSPQVNIISHQGDIIMPSSVETNSPVIVVSSPPPEIFKRGERIAYTKSENGNHYIYLANTDGSNPQRLLSTARSQYMPSFSFDGLKIFFVNTLVDNANDIYKVNQDGSGLERVTTLAQKLSSPQVSQEGNLIFILNKQLYLQEDDKLFKMSNSPVPITNPHWLNNNQLAFLKMDKITTGNIFMLSKDGSGLFAVTKDEVITTFDFNNNMFAFSDEKGLWVSDAKIHNKVLITQDSKISEIALAKDSDTIAFTSEKTGKKQIYTIRTSGSDLKQITCDGECFSPSL